MFAKSLTLVSSVLVGAFSLLADTITWVGPTGDWSDPTLWDLQRVPEAGDDVIITTPAAKKEKKSVTLTTSTPLLKSLSLSAAQTASAITLTASGWDTAIQAETISVGKFSTITCANGGETEDTLSRVWIKCTDLLIKQGGAVDASRKGYNGTYEKKYAVGFGPGAGAGSGAANGGGAKGAAHGGYGGAFHGIRTLPYGDAENPLTAGSSGGFAQYSGELVAGGGVVTIAATGIVTVNGSILASSKNTAKYGDTSVNDSTAGAGGSILIVADAIKGENGVIRADGGSASCPHDFNTGRVGGGGRIAIKYNPESQQDGFISNLTISAAPGLYKWKESSVVYSLNSSDSDTYRSEADLGTLWFTDNKMLAGLGTCIWGQIVNVDEITLPSLSLTNGHVRFSKEGVKVNVTGDLTISGSSARLEIGGFLATNNNDFASLHAGKAPSALTVGGKLRVENGGRLDVRAAVPEAGTVGATVEVAGAMEVMTGGRVIPWCDSDEAGAPRFSVGSLTVDATSEITADGRGFAGGFALYQDKNAVIHSNGFGPGYGKAYSSTVGVGGGHGGTGGGRLTSGYGGASYDDPYQPTKAGSGGCVPSKWMFKGGTGGGVVDIRATGAVAVAGRISADGEVADGRGASTAGAGSGSGGAIFLYGKTVSSTVGSVISARGGDAELVENSLYGAGGGGRISIFAGAAASTEGIKPKRITQSTELTDMPEAISLAGTVTAAAGVDTSSASANDGTVWYTHIADLPGLLMLLR